MGKVRIRFGLLADFAGLSVVETVVLEAWPPEDGLDGMIHASTTGVPSGGSVVCLTKNCGSRQSLWNADKVVLAEDAVVQSKTSSSVWLSLAEFVREREIGVGFVERSEVLEERDLGSRYDEPGIGILRRPGEGISEDIHFARTVDDVGVVFCKKFDSSCLPRVEVSLGWDGCEGGVID